MGKLIGIPLQKKKNKRVALAEQKYFIRRSSIRPIAFFLTTRFHRVSKMQTCIASLQERNIKYIRFQANLTLKHFHKFVKFQNSPVLSWIGFAFDKGCNVVALPSWLSGKESAWQYRRYRRPWFEPWVGKIPWRRKWQPAPVYLLIKSHGQRSLVDYSP